MFEIRDFGEIKPIAVGPGLTTTEWAKLLNGASGDYNLIFCCPESYGKIRTLMFKYIDRKELVFIAVDEAHYYKEVLYIYLIK